MKKCKQSTKIADNMALKDSIRHLRKQRRWRQKELADRLGVSVVTVKSWEGGRTEPESPNRRKLLKVFGITDAELYGGGASAPQAMTRITPSVTLQPKIEIDRTAQRYEVVLQVLVEVVSTKPIS